MQRGIIGIYKIINNDNGKVYIGQSVDVEYRLCNHFSCLRHNRHDNEHLQRAYNLNPAAFTWELIQECDVDDLDVLEVYYICKYDSTDRNKGYNRSFGGQLAHKATDETRAKMSKTKKGKKFTEEHCHKIGEANRKRKLSDETKSKISSKHKVPILQYSREGIFIARFDGIQDAADKLHLKSKSSISNVLRGKAPTGAGFIWKYDK